MAKERILIEVKGGNIQHIAASQDIDIVIIDHDNLSAGNGSLAGWDVPNEPDRIATVDEIKSIGQDLVKEYLPKLVMNKITKIEIDSDDYNSFISGIYGGDCEFVAIEEANNNSSYSYSVPNEHPMEMHEEDKADIRKGIYKNYTTQRQFECLFEDGFIEAGEYTIVCSW